MSEPIQVAGTAVHRRDLFEKVTGAATYTVDVQPPGVLHAKVVRSTYAHATIARIDKSAALAVPGVVAVIESSDLEGLVPRFGHIVPDHCILAIDKVRYYGEPVVLVVAESLFAAEDAAELVTIDYVELPAAMTAAEALTPEAPLVHEERYRAATDESFAAMSASPTGSDTDTAEDNIAHEVSLEWGDVDAAFEEAFLVVATEDVHYPMLYGYAMEPYNAVADFSKGRLHVVSTAQHPFMVRTDLARIFDLPLARVRVEAPYLGGGYGTKSYTKVEPLAAIASWATGRPVKLVLDVEEAIYTTRADSAVVSVRSAFDAEGRILARDIDMVLDSGAYADNSPLVLAKAVNRSFGPYRVPHLRVRGRSVYTNTSPASSYRGFGAPQGSLAGEMNLDQAADRLGLDAFEIRRRNLVAFGEEILPGKRGIDADLLADLDMLRTSLPDAPEEHAGLGIGFTASDAGAFPVSTAQVRIQYDGSVILSTGSTEMGQGSQSALAQITAQELGVPLDSVSVQQSDTGRGPYERTTGASRTTTLAGLAVQRACDDARTRVLAMAVEVFGPEADIAPAPGGVLVDGGTTVGYGEVVCRWFGAAAGEVTGVGLVRRDGTTQKMPPFWEVGVVGVVVDVDPDLGVVTVRQLSTVADVGFAVNPRAVEGQDLGAATQGMGGALFEELVYDGPQLLNPNVVEYRVPRITDVPATLDLLIAERGDGVGPYGAKGAGEGTLNPMAAAITTAVARATGTWPTRVPLTPERVWRLLNERPAEDRA